MLLRPGLTSITHRQLSPAEVISLAAKAHLVAIEWGADVHLPPGSPGLAHELAARCQDAGLDCPSYGTYFRVGRDEPSEFSDLVQTARALGATQLRVWAGTSDSASATSEELARVVDQSRRVAARAAEAGLAIAFEFHDGTVNDTATASRRLIEAVDRPNVRTYWQPPVGMTDDAAAAQLTELIDLVTTVHVFSWDSDGGWLPLADRHDMWQRVVRQLEATGVLRHLLLEHVQEHDPRMLLRDASVLTSWCARDQAAAR
jgi:3-dehydroshikimate dehydratase